MKRLTANLAIALCTVASVSHIDAVMAVPAGITVPSAAPCTGIDAGRFSMACQVPSGPNATADNDNPVRADSLIEFNASNYTLESLDNGKHRDDGRQRPENPQQRHNCDPKPAHLVDLFIDYRMMGLGGDDSWGAKPHKIYQIDPAVGKISYGFALVPLDKNASIDKAIKQY